MNKNRKIGWAFFLFAALMFLINTIIYFSYKDLPYYDHVRAGVTILGLMYIVAGGYFIGKANKQDKQGGRQ